MEGQHYICGGDCEGVSDQPKSCDSEGCSGFGQPLKPCDCKDGQHQAADADPAKDRE